MSDSSGSRLRRHWRTSRLTSRGGTDATVRAAAGTVDATVTRGSSSTWASVGIGGPNTHIRGTRRRPRHGSIGRAAVVPWRIAGARGALVSARERLTSLGRVLERVDEPERVAILTGSRAAVVAVYRDADRLKVADDPAVIAEREQLRTRRRTAMTATAGPEPGTHDLGGNPSRDVRRCVENVRSCLLVQAVNA